MTSTRKSTGHRYPQTITVYVTKEDIEYGKCADPNKCMIKIAVKREIGGHGYVSVDASGISITRRPDYREKAFLPKKVIKQLILWDKDPALVKPFSFKLTFFKTSPIQIMTAKQKAEWAARKEERGGYRAYNPRLRVIGLAASE